MDGLYGNDSELAGETRMANDNGLALGTRTANDTGLEKRQRAGNGKDQEARKRFGERKYLKEATVILKKRKGSQPSGVSEELFLQKWRRQKAAEADICSSLFADNAVLLFQVYNIELNSSFKSQPSQNFLRTKKAITESQ